MPVGSQTCSATKRDGTPCTVQARPSGFCWAHAPELAEQRRRVRVTGGRHSSTASRSLKALPAALRPVWQALVELVPEVRAGTATPQEATAVAALAARLLDYARFAAEVREIAAVERRLAELEQRLPSRGRF